MGVVMKSRSAPSTSVKSEMPEHRGPTKLQDPPCPAPLKGLALLEGRGRRKNKEGGVGIGGVGKSKQFPPRKRSIPYGFDFDLDEVWAPLNPHLKHVYKNGETQGHKPNDGQSSTSAKNNISSSNSATSEQSLRQGPEPTTADSEFETEGDIFQQIAGLSNRLESSSVRDPVHRDSFGREVSRRDSLDSIDTGDNSSPFSTMTRMQLSPVSTASSRHSYDSVPLSRHRSYSSGSHASLQRHSSAGSRSRQRRLSAGSINSTLSRNQSPGGPRRVGNSANCLTPGLGGVAARKKKHGSRGSSPSRADQ